MNRRKLFALLAALPVAAMARIKPLQQPYEPPMRELGQWALGGYFTDPETGATYSSPDMLLIRYDVTFVDQNGGHHQIGVDQSFSETPTEEQLIEARKTARRIIKRSMGPQKAYISETWGHVPAKKALIPVGPSDQMPLNLPPNCPISRYV